MRSPWSAWKARRLRLALQQLEAGQHDPTNDILRTDAISGDMYLGRRALGKLLSPKATSHTEWRGD